jgi:hypothetical protein
MSKEIDPREIVTPDAFSVSDSLLGLPLAHPWRRAAAMLVDLFLVAILANAKGVFLAIAAGAFLFWLAYRGRKAGLGSAMARATLGCGGALVVFVAVVAIWGSVFRDIPVATIGDQGEGGARVTLGDLGDLARLMSAEDTAEAAAAASRIVDRLESEGVEPAEIRAALGDIEGEEPAARAIQQALGQAERDRQSEAGMDLGVLGVDSLLTLYEAARAGGDTVAAVRTGTTLGRRLVQDEWEARERRVSALEARSQRLESELDETEAELEAERNRGPIAMMLAFLDELGLGIGWSGLYFTFLTAFMRGRTPGKRLLGVRVVRLDGGTLTYWVAFERFGGYAASLFTGMEGFLRILWDRNRQCLQDKLAETVVIRETKDARAQLAVGAARDGMEAKPWKGGPIRGT